MTVEMRKVFFYVIIYHFHRGLVLKLRRDFFHVDRHYKNKFRHIDMEMTYTQVK